jgi:hypothetical protein
MLRFAVAGISLILLAGVGVSGVYGRTPPEGAAAYHAKVRSAIPLVPYNLGDWVGVDTEIRAEALRILDANATLSRHYTNTQTGQSATLLLVQCQDSRSLLGHYPPNCYPSQGWTSLRSELRKVAGGGVTIAANEYAFKHEALGGAANLSVLHFTVLPDGTTSPDMSRLEYFSHNLTKRPLGGASVQFVVDGTLRDSDRNELYGILLQLSADWIRTVQGGIDS